MDIGFIGVGNMGFGMANNIIKGGHALIVHDVRRDAASPLLEQGATWAETPQQVAAQSEITFTSLPGPPEVEAVALGDTGILAGCRPGSVYIDLSTNAPSLVRRLHAILQEQGVHMLDAPVSGGVVGARTGLLAVMVGGDEAIYNRMKPTLDAIGSRWPRPSPGPVELPWSCACFSWCDTRTFGSWIRYALTPNSTPSRSPLSQGERGRG